MEEVEYYSTGPYLICSCDKVCLILTHSVIKKCSYYIMVAGLELASSSLDILPEFIVGNAVPTIQNRKPNCLLFSLVRQCLGH